MKGNFFVTLHRDFLIVLLLFAFINIDPVVQLRKQPNGGGLGTVR